MSPAVMPVSPAFISRRNTSSRVDWLSAAKAPRA